MFCNPLESKLPLGRDKTIGLSGIPPEFLSHFETSRMLVSFGSNPDFEDMLLSVWTWSPSFRGKGSYLDFLSAHSQSLYKV